MRKILITLLLGLSLVFTNFAFAYQEDMIDIYNAIEIIVTACYADALYNAPCYVVLDNYNKVALKVVNVVDPEVVTYGRDVCQELCRLGHRLGTEDQAFTILLKFMRDLDKRAFGYNPY